MCATTPHRKGTSQTECEQESPMKLSPSAIDRESEENKDQNSGRNGPLPRQVTAENKKFLSGPLMPDNAFSPKKLIGDENR